MASYNDTYTTIANWVKPFQRTEPFPLDRSSLFGSLKDAQKYASGGGDDRNLGATSYIGQIITVYENDEVNVYKINSNRDLEELCPAIEIDDAPSDWNAKEGESGYIENRTHYYDSSTESYLVEHYEDKYDENDEFIGVINFCEISIDKIHKYIDIQCVNNTNGTSFLQTIETDKEGSYYEEGFAIEYDKHSYIDIIVDITQEIGTKESESKLSAYIETDIINNDIVVNNNLSFNIILK